MSAYTPLINRFCSKIVVADTGCWEWQASKSEGYGYISVGTRWLVAHRVLYEYLRGPLPRKLELDHLCRNRGCVNPGHLEPVTTRENIHRGQGVAGINARKTLCKNNHFLSESSYLYPYKGTIRRICRRCF